MGERLSGEGLPARRRGHPGGTVLGSATAGPDTGFEARIADALRGGGADGVDPEAERRAVAAFRTARDSGRRARTRRRDDWRPGRPHRARLSLRTTLSVLLASLTLGGVAFAAMGSPGFAGHDDGGTGPRRTRPPVSAQNTAGTTDRHRTAEPGGTVSAAPSARPDHPANAQDTRAHCRAYEQVRGRGKALDSTAWQRLVLAAGGEDDVADYCAARLASPARTPSPARTSTPGNGTGNGTGNVNNGATNGATNGTGNGATNGTGNGADNSARNGGGTGKKAAGPK
ncbi:hypothetical protein ACF09I_00235 [Streptomyces sp. NPDC014940]|uniref:hypothetical protein n=1 Tax=Streptomyces sp. NPDC014940 TaxID=3364932 RepID=UPI0036FF0559